MIVSYDISKAKQGQGTATEVSRGHMLTAKAEANATVSKLRPKI